MTFHRTRCAHCRQKFAPERPSQIVHLECVEPWAIAQAEKREREEAKKARATAKVERAEIRRRKEAIKTIPDLLREAQHAFNAYIRERDQNQPCICCGLPLKGLSGSTGGNFDCGHYRSVGSAGHLRFDERNAHGQRKQCNRHGAGRAVDYRIGLIKRIGLDAVESLESDNTITKWTSEYLIELKAHYRRKLRDLKTGRVA